MRTCLFFSVMFASACTPGDVDPLGPPDEPVDEPVPDPLGTYAPTGDPEAGALAILDGQYVQCGVPRDWAELYWGSSELFKVDGRSPANADLPFYLTAYEAPSGVDLAATNCLYCHGDLHYGDVVLGLGDASLSFTTDQTPYVSVATDLVVDDAERAEVARWAERVLAASPWIVTDTVGVNPADTLAQALFAHRDPLTLEWSAEPMMDPPLEPVPTDIPPLWGLRKKTRMLYTGAARGNLARVMMTATVLCTESTADADALYPMFQDIWAWMAELEPPPYTFDIDPSLAATGEALFGDHCAGCHGTYGEAWTYPNLVVSVDEVGTDPTMVERFLEDGVRHAEWFNSSWYGQDAALTEPEGYIAPPLDGIWATAPYLHNGSVPTLGDLLDSAARPTYWERNGYQAAGQVGVGVTLHEVGRDVVDDTRVYDTTRPGYSNAGHTYGDALTVEERDAVLEYLKTL